MVARPIKLVQNDSPVSLKFPTHLPTLQFPPGSRCPLFQEVSGIHTSSVPRQPKSTQSPTVHSDTLSPALINLDTPHPPKQPAPTLSTQIPPIQMFLVNSDTPDLPSHPNLTGGLIPASLPSLLKGG